MKFHWFAEVTYPDLPDDLAQRYGSSWVDVPRRLYDPERGGATYHAYLNEYEYADALGFDGIAVNEHHQYAGAMTPSPNLFAAILARTTRNAAVLVIGDSIALYQPPIRVAEELAMLDVLSGGRVIAGLVLGTPMDAAFCYGVPPVDLRARWHEAHDLILRAWTAPAPFAFNGRYTQLRYVNVWPRPLQQPHPPIWVPGAGSVETWELVTERNYCYGHLSLSGLARAKPVVDGYWEFVAKAGGDMNPYRMAFTQMICVSETDGRAEAEYSEAVKYFYRNSGPVARRFLTAPGYQSARSMAKEAQLRGGTSEHQQAVKGELSWRDYVEKGFVIAGSPATVRDQLREVATQLRVGQLICIFQMGNLSEEQTKKNTYLFAKEVMPHLRDLWSEYDDHWTPKRSQERVAALTTQAQSGG